MIVSGILKLVGAGLEFFLGIPVIGGSFILALYWAPLLFMLVYHIVTLVLAKKENQAIWGAVTGITASALGFILVLGMILHWAAFICLLIDGILSFNKNKNKPTDQVIS